MKTIETLKELYPKLNSLLGEIDNLIKEDTKKIKKEYTMLITEARINILNEICQGEGLNLIEIRNKYLTEKEKKNINFSLETVKEVVHEVLLDTVEIKNIIYYYENKENGIIFDSKSKEVGVFKKGQYIITK